MESIAIVGLACRYPDAESPSALWQMTLAQRRAFRPVPPERLPLVDYGGDASAEDLTCGVEAAVLTNWEFDRVQFRVARATHRTVDPSHWLALECADKALDDAGFAKGDKLPKATTAVIVGNSLTGDYSRAAALRLRWPYVRRTVQAALEEAGVGPDRTRELLMAAERRFKQPLPDVTAETLAGWLSNTIAGRICNHFDFGGGGYVVDGACSSSLLAVTTACDALRAGTADAVLAGGVDLSLDPLELVGFARAQALTTGEMLVYDEHASGFTPGEGCGFAVLMREVDARALGCRIYACVRGWGVASDGHGGITRPEVAGQRRALQRAYRAAGFGIDTVAYFEGHGTGTPVGDAAEITALMEERRCAGAATPASIGSIKANIGHTKAAAGIAGFIKATLALHSRILPPTTGCRHPVPALLADGANVQIERTGRLWPSGARLRASVSAMGFGGINAHLALEAATDDRRAQLSDVELACLRSPQDVEVFPLSAADPAGLLAILHDIRQRARRMSRAELTDAAISLQLKAGEGVVRAALVAANLPELEAACALLQHALERGLDLASAPNAGAFLGRGGRTPRIVLLFPGQGSPSHSTGGLWRRRFRFADELYEVAGDTGGHNHTDTRVAQPAIVRASVAGLHVLNMFGIRASAAMGHSLGELCALHWGGAFDQAALLRIVTARSAAMGACGAPGGGMASVAAPPDDVAPYVDGRGVVIAAFNGVRQTIIAGPLGALRPVCERLTAASIAVRHLAVSHAFHSPGMVAAAGVFSNELAREDLRPVSRQVISTITGRAWQHRDDQKALLVQQLTSPVRFVEALAAVERDTDLFIETGPGDILSGLVAGATSTPVVSLDAGSESLRGALTTAAAAFTAGADVRWAELARDRFARPFDFDRSPTVLVSPCEAGLVMTEARAEPRVLPQLAPAAGEADTSDGPYGVARRLVASRAELPIEAVHRQHRLLSDLHLNSITSTQIVVDLARALGAALPRHPIEYADASIGAIVSALLSGGPPSGQAETTQPAGIASWIRTFQVRWYEQPRAAVLTRRDPAPGRLRVVGDEADLLTRALQHAARESDIAGTLVCLPDRVRTRDVIALVHHARAALAAGGPLAIVQRNAGGGAFARALWLENMERDVLVANLHGDDATAVRMLLDELRHLKGFAEVRLGNGERQVPYAVPIHWADTGDTPVGRGDVLLVTGGGKGIAAESALALAVRFGLRLGILGRSDPATDTELAANLARLASRGVPVRYVRSDVTDAAAVRLAVLDIEGHLGTIRSVLHGAGINDPALLHDLTDATVSQTLAIKVDGLINVLDAIDASQLRLCIGFGSLTARTGLRGDAHYAAANELMVRALEDWGGSHPQCRCLGLEWSVWAGTGMGARLGRLAGLERAGIAPLTIDQGTSLLCELAGAPDARGTVLATSRFPQGPTLRIAGQAPPAWRFLERPIAWYPGVELVADADLTLSSDLSLDDHVVHGERVFPGVFGLEAMAQAAAALLGPDQTRDVEFTSVAFERPIVVPTSGGRRIRIAALRTGDAVDVAIRSDESLFAAEHVRARVRFVSRGWRTRPRAWAAAPSSVTVDAAPLYEHMFFQRGRFRRVAAYSDLQATRCTATLTPAGPEPWFSTFLSDTLVLGDPGARDALMHAIQPCVPERTLLPTAVRRILIGRSTTSQAVTASEQSNDGSTFVYDACALDSEGRECERWEGLSLRALGASRPREAWLPALIGPALERAVALFATPKAVRAFVARVPSGSHVPGRMVASWVTGRAIDRRPDGQPQFADGAGGRVSIAHDGELVVTVSGRFAALACDLQACEPRAVNDWLALLGPDHWQLARLISIEAQEPLDTAAARVWCAVECRKKSGAALDVRLELQEVADGWLVLSAEGTRIVTRAFTILPDRRRLMAAVLCSPAWPAANASGSRAAATVATEARA
jgi:enediyne polyketide synthase